MLRGPSVEGGGVELLRGPTVTPTHAARLIRHERKRQGSSLLGRAHVHIHRKCILDRTAQISPRAIADIAAQHHQPMPKVAHEMLERLLLDEVASRDPATARQAHLLKLLGRQLSEELDYGQPVQT